MTQKSPESDQKLDDLATIQEPITTATTEVREIIERDLKLEKDKLYLKTPRNINDDILQIIKDTVQWNLFPYNCVTSDNFMAKL